jgi:acyl carrier protein
MLVRACRLDRLGNFPQSDGVKAAKKFAIQGFILSTHLRQVLALLDDTLSLNGRSAAFDRDTALLGALPELDSMAVASVLTGIEEAFGVSIGDDEVDGSVFATVGTLADFIEQKLA